MQAETNILFQLFQGWEHNQKISIAMQKWLPWGICSNPLGQEMKHHKSILNGGFMHLYIENMKY